MLKLGKESPIVSMDSKSASLSGCATMRSLTASVRGASKANATDGELVRLAGEKDLGTCEVTHSSANTIQMVASCLSAGTVSIVYTAGVCGTSALNAMNAWSSLAPAILLSATRICKSKFLKASNRRTSLFGRLRSMPRHWMEVP